MDKRSQNRGFAVPIGRVARLSHFGAMTAGIAGRFVAGGLRQLAQGERPDLAGLLITPQNAMRVAQKLSQMRGAALKMGQMLSMDAGAVLGPEITAILASLRDDAKHMPPKQLQSVLNAEWGAGWRSRFARFDLIPFAAASIGQVHRAQLLDGSDLAIKVQYPGVRASIDSDISNIATLLRLPGLLPRDLDLAPLLDKARSQLHAEADYTAEARQLTQFAQLLAGSDVFTVPQVYADFSTSQVLAMRYIESQPLDHLAAASPDLRNRVARHLIKLTLQELFDFGAMQTDPNFANYRYDPQNDRIVLLDFGAVQSIPKSLSDDFRQLLDAALCDDLSKIRAAMLRIGYFDASLAPHQQRLIEQMFRAAMAPLRAPDIFDFATSDLLERLRDMGLRLGQDRDLAHVPPAETLFLHRKIGGIYLLAAKLRARLALNDIVAPYRDPPPSDLK
jgi:predicted unusual protein kinase regulating ubiquinone biosynthesis (AarF/ABC1/UbiB family)